MYAVAPLINSVDNGNRASAVSRPLPDGNRAPILLPVNGGDELASLSCSISVLA